jgi:hypothetical protein
MVPRTVEMTIVIKANRKEKKKELRYFSDCKKARTQRRERPLGGKERKSPEFKPANTTITIGASR